ncbi:MAG: RluA family pseudouridine synthase [Treponema sp.]|nr:RluA family pseudouridine synthase [Treponema sp.]
MIKQWKVQQQERLDSFLRREIPLVVEKEISNGKIRRLILAGCVSVNSKQCRIPAYDLKVGSTVSADIQEEKLFFEKSADDIDFTLTQKDVLFEDEYIIVVNKPAYLPTEDTFVKERKSMHSCVVEYLWNKNRSLRNPPYAGIMHRLDKETSGVLLFTKKREANKSLSEQFSQHTINKIYRAVCEVKIKPQQKEFTVENFLTRISSKSSACKMGITKDETKGQNAKTKFKIVKEDEKKVFVECILFTGRTHQIRVHLSSKGLPICGDELYGSTVKGRIMLHAHTLEFTHPVSGERMKIESPLSAQFL